jgi:hypothetical protein
VGRVVRHYFETSRADELGVVVGSVGPEAVEEEREEVRRLLVELRYLDLEYSMSAKVGEMMTVSFQQRDAESLHESRVKEYKAEIARLTQQIGKYEMK